MAKYNILRENDDFPKKVDNKEKVEITDFARKNEDETAEFSPGPPPESRVPGEEFFTDDIFSALKADETVPPKEMVSRDEDNDILTDDQLAPELDFPSEEEPEKFEVSEKDTVQADFPSIEKKSERPVYDYDDDYSY